MKKMERALRILVVAALISFLPISAMAGAFRPPRPGGGGGNSRSVPEPTTLLLLLTGGGIMMVKKFRKK